MTSLWIVALAVAFALCLSEGEGLLPLVAPDSPDYCGVGGRVCWGNCCCFPQQALIQCQDQGEEPVLGPLPYPDRYKTVEFG